ncbi:MAG: HEAT repeat domain-containing protein [Planctomycetes bacterium]|nr:HEAT repeat domain-containing protein [Planctomycetota bacterium]
MHGVPMRPSVLSPTGFLVLGALLAVQIGCANGPLPYLTAMNPSMRRQWEADEQYQPTLHRQLAEVDELRDGAARLSEGEQRHWAGEMKYIVETHDSPQLRAAAVQALAAFTVPQAADGLRVAVKDGDPLVRIAACKAWGQRASRESPERLAEVLGSDSDVDVRIVAARELGRFNQPLAFQALGLALNDKDPSLRYRAIDSLKKASGRDYGNDVEAWQKFAQGVDPGPEYQPSLAERARELLF